MSKRSEESEEEELPFEATTEWKPVFDKGDDLDGLLDAGSPLLGRAFSGRPRAQPTREAT